MPFGLWVLTRCSARPFVHIAHGVGVGGMRGK